MASFEVKLDDKVSGPAKKAAKSTSDLQDSLKQLDTGTRGAGVTLEEAGLGLEALAASAAAAVVAVAALAAAAIGAGMALSVMAGEDRQAMEAFGAAMLGTASAGKEVDELLKSLGQDLPITKDKIDKLAKGFMSAGIRDLPALEKALRATAASTALMGEEGGAAFANLLKKAELFGQAGRDFKNFSKSLKDTGLDVNDVAKQFGITGQELETRLKNGTINAKQLGDALQDAMIAKGANAVDVANRKLSVMLDKAKTALVDLFDGVVETEGYKAFIDAIKQIGALFQLHSKEGESAIVSMFGAMFEIAAKVLTWMTKAFLTLAIATVKFYIWIHPTAHAIAEMGRAVKKATLENETFMRGLKWTAIVIGALLIPELLLLGAAWLISMLPVIIATAAIAALVYGFIWLVGVIADNIIPILEALAVALLLPLAPFAAIGLAVWLLWDDIVAAWDAIWAYLGGLYDKALAVAKSFVSGLILGITGGMKGVGVAAGDLGAEAAKSAAAALKAHSPSLVMFELGTNIGEGLELGMAASNDNVAGSASSLGQSAISGVAGGAGEGGGKGGVTVNFEAGAIQINGAGKSGEEITEEVVSLVFERIALASGY